MGSNTKAAIVRLGLKEMEAFIRHFYPATSSHVFSESCGVADLITTCFAGRNRKCAEAFAASRVEGTDAMLTRVLEAAGQAMATPPVVCELCHKGFRCKENLIHHCEGIHGGYVEYRKHVFWKAAKAGLQPLQPWYKRFLLSTHAHFLRFSIPGSHVNDYCRSVDKAVPRRMEACAICAVKDWIEHRTH